MSLRELPAIAEVIELPAPRSSPRTAARPVPHTRRWPGYALIACGVALVPWLVALAVNLPSTAATPHWTVAWVGLDSMEAAALIATGVLTLRRSPRRAALAGATAMLLVVDAWFDMTTASGGDFTAALIMALTAELPLAAACATLALSSNAGRA